jgi:hypothetical protein
MFLSNYGDKESPLTYRRVLWCTKCGSLKFIDIGCGGATKIEYPSSLFNANAISDVTWGELLGMLAMASFFVSPIIAGFFDNIWIFMGTAIFWLVFLFMYVVLNSILGSSERQKRDYDRQWSIKEIEKR